jgi:hypothetical protein
MTTINRRTPNGSQTDLDCSQAGSPTARPSAQLILDGVIASYIHEISGRHPRQRISRDATATSEQTALYR